jgi:hypothetical protein
MGILVKKEIAEGIVNKPIYSSDTIRKDSDQGEVFHT